MENKYQLLGFCGIYCGTDCNIYRAMHSETFEEKQKIAESLSQELGIKIAISELHCKGCQGPEEEIWFEYRLCLIRKCGKIQNIKVCIECKDAPCKIFKIRFSQSEKAPKNLLKIREVGLNQWIEKKRAIMCMIEASKFNH